MPEPGARRLANELLDPLVSALRCVVLGLWMRITVPRFHMSARDTNSGPHTHTASPSSPELFLQPVPHQHSLYSVSPALTLCQVLHIVPRVSCSFSRKDLKQPVTAGHFVRKDTDLQRMASLFHVLMSSERKGWLRFHLNDRKT